MTVPDVARAPSELPAQCDFKDLHCQTLQTRRLKTNMNFEVSKTEPAPRRALILLAASLDGLSVSLLVYAHNIQNDSRPRMSSGSCGRRLR